jgi:hypothetical protein
MDDSLYECYSGYVLLSGLYLIIIPNVSESVSIPTISCNRREGGTYLIPLERFCLDHWNHLVN